MIYGKFELFFLIRVKNPPHIIFEKVAVDVTTCATFLKLIVMQLL